jgi:hypothetical protein
MLSEGCAMHCKYRGINGMMTAKGKNTNIDPQHQLMSASKLYLEA